MCWIISERLRHRHFCGILVASECHRHICGILMASECHGIFVAVSWLKDMPRAVRHNKEYLLSCNDDGSVAGDISCERASGNDVQQKLDRFSPLPSNSPRFVTLRPKPINNVTVTASRKSQHSILYYSTTNGV